MLRLCWSVPSGCQITLLVVVVVVEPILLVMCVTHVKRNRINSTDALLVLLLTHGRVFFSFFVQLGCHISKSLFCDTDSHLVHLRQILSCKSIPGGSSSLCSKRPFVAKAASIRVSTIRRAADMKSRSSK